MSLEFCSETRSHDAVDKRAGSTQKTLSTIGDLAREFGVSLRTIRFYEDRGLLTPLRNGNSRLYDTNEKARLCLILKGKQLGFTLGEIRDLIGKETGAAPPKALPLNPDQISLQITHLERQRTDIEEAIVELRATHKRLMENS